MGPPEVALRATRRRLTPELGARFRAEGSWIDRCLHECLFDASRTHGERVAISDGVWRLTFAALEAAVKTTAEALREAGMGPRSIVGVRTANQVEFVVSHVAISAIGAITLSLPSSLGPREVAELLRLGDADGLVTDGALPRIDDTEDLLIWSYRHEAQGEPFPLPAGAPTHSGEPAPFASDPDADYIMMPTAGTTGLPRIAVRTHNAWLAMARKKLTMIEPLDLGPNDCVLVLSPAGQGIGYFHGFVIPSLVPGMRRVLLERFDPDAALDAIERERVTLVVGVPAQAIKILGAASLQGRDLSSLKMFQSGGDAFEPSIRRALEDGMGVPLSVDYGASDVGAACGTRLDDPPEKRSTTSGRPMPWTSVFVRDADGAELPAGSEGEVWIFGPDVISGYYPEDDSAGDAERGYPTGDIGVFDEEGFLSIVGRRKDIIIRGGLNISPMQVERAALLYPAIKEAAAVGVPDPVLGERVCVFATVAAGSAPTSADVARHLEGLGVSRSLWPELLVVIDELPLSPGGKVDKRALRETLGHGSTSVLHGSRDRKER